MVYKIEVSKIARKDLKRLPPEVSLRILEKIKFFSSSQSVFSFAKKLKSEKIGDYRFRVGDYRVIFDQKGKTFIILSIDHRKDIYRK